ncbi:methylmalonyl-CoA mutase, large subunit [Opitutus terrae PB90-1]|uniref:Methylmalonyl-CoA mutase, large subunit n=2 Tax=Opitutus terrae TaxID=107709 RepID=B1ZTD0_OPITP|nr:methylmalonyl-CoA mutase, large subunit [Opitutus terrae PB90-1]
MPDLPTSSQVSADPLAAALARWRATVDAELKGASFEKKFVTRTFEGISLQPLYTRADLAGVPHLGTAPGAAPFLRGTRKQGYKDKIWRIAQESTASDAEAFNTAIRQDLAAGQDAVVLRPDLASRAGRDPDAARPEELGVDGVSLATLDDLNTALKDVDLTAVPVNVQTGADALPIAALYLQHAKIRGVDWTRLTGAVSADPLGEWLARGELPTTLEELYDNLAAWTKWAGNHAPALHTIGVNAAMWGEAGGTATQELAFALAAAAEYLRALYRHGLRSESVATRMSFRFAIGPQFFTEIAKFRAFRPLWTRVVTAFGATADTAAGASVHAVTGHWDKTLLDPHVNLLRVTTEALSAVLGGCDSLHIAPFDEVAGSSDEFSRRIARNVHTLLAEEFSFAETADPAGGSWYVEKLTDTLARNAWALFQDIESKGGLTAALRAGYPQQLVAKAAGEKADAIAKRRLGLVGTNLFPNLKEKPLAPVSVDTNVRAAELVARVRARRRGPQSPAPISDWNARFNAALAAARDGATVGELSRMAQASATGEGAITPVVARRASEAFEQLRAASAAFAAKTGARPKVFLAKMGPVLQHKARADFSAGFFAVGGFESIGKQSFETPESAAAAAVASGAKIAVLCSTDDTYPALVPVFAKAVKAAAPKTTVVLAGLPADAAVVAAFREAGVDEFIHIRANVYELLAKFQKQIGAL